jgi:hypothetical protein
MQWFIKTNLCFDMKLRLHWYGALTDKLLEVVSTDKQCVEGILDYQLDEELRSCRSTATTYTRRSNKEGKTVVDGKSASLKNSQVAVVCVFSYINCLSFPVRGLVVY